jgi:3-deoxy-D-manno-octulosonate 8-phosphate phosphatase (KDO 8-P phosphatase)
MNEDLKQRLKAVQLVLMDVDGVLTDGRFYFIPGPDGLTETKGFDSRDGIALQWLRRFSIPAGLISGRKSIATDERARSASFRYVYTGNTEKIPMLNEILADAKIPASAVAYMGDDLTDIVIMRRVGMAVATANARPHVKKYAHYVTEAEGGSGAVREFVELLLEAKGHWDEVLRHYEALD